jgi:acetaldehyde dehydrogenase
VLGAAGAARRDGRPRGIDAVLTRNGEVEGRQGPVGRGARQPGDRGGLAGPQGRRLRRAARGRAHRSCPARAPGRSTPARRRVPGRLRRASATVTCRSNRGDTPWLKADRRDRRVRQHRHRPAVQAAALGVIEPRWMVGIDPASEGLRRAPSSASRPAHEGVDWLLAQDELPDLVFEATSAYVHRANAPRYAEAGIRRSTSPRPRSARTWCPPVNLRRAPRRAERQPDHLRRPGHDPDGARGLPGDAGAVRRDRRVRRVPSAGPGTRANIDEFTRTTGRGVEVIGGAQARQGDHHPQPGRAADDHARHHLLRDPPDADRDAIAESIVAMVAEVQSLRARLPAAQRAAVRRPPSPRPARQARVAIFVEVEGAGDFLPPYAGNLDIMTAAATRVGEEIAAILPPRREEEGSDAAPTASQPTRRPDHRHLAARRLARQAPPVHRRRGARHRRGARRRRRAGHRGDPRRRPRRLVVQLRLQPRRRSRS